MKTSDEILNEMGYFIGTESYHRLSPWLVLTDGAKWLAESAECFWLFDIVSSIVPMMRKVKESFLHVKLTVQDDNSAVVLVDDGNGGALYKQNIEYTDFPLKSFSFFVSDGGEYYVAMLKSEY